LRKGSEENDSKTTTATVDSRHMRNNFLRPNLAAFLCFLQLQVYTFATSSGFLPLGFLFACFTAQEVVAPLLS